MSDCDSSKHYLSVIVVDVVVNFYIFTTSRKLLHKFCTVSGWLSGSASTSHTVGRGFASQPAHSKDHQKMVQTASLHCTQALG